MKKLMQEKKNRAARIFDWLVSLGVMVLWFALIVGAWYVLMDTDWYGGRW